MKTVHYTCAHSSVLTLLSACVPAFLFACPPTLLGCVCVYSIQDVADCGVARGGAQPHRL